VVGHVVATGTMAIKQKIKARQVMNGWHASHMIGNQEVQMLCGYQNIGRASKSRTHTHVHKWAFLCFSCGTWASSSPFSDGYPARLAARF